MRMWMARTSAIVAGCLMLAAAAVAFEFKDEVGRFSASFPAEPTLDKEEGSSALGPHVHYTWEVDADDRHWSVTYTEYSRAAVKNYDKNVMSLLAATKAQAAAADGKIELSGVDGREIVHAAARQGR